MQSVNGVIRVGEMRGKVPQGLNRTTPFQNNRRKDGCAGEIRSCSKGFCRRERRRRERRRKTWVGMKLKRRRGNRGWCDALSVMMRAIIEEPPLCTVMVRWAEGREADFFWGIFRSGFQPHRNRGACVDTRIWTGSNRVRSNRVRSRWSWSRFNIGVTKTKSTRRCEAAGCFGFQLWKLIVSRLESFK